MTSGKNHDRGCIIFGAIAMVPVAALCPAPASLAAGYIIGSVWLSPDIDLPHSLPSQRWGPFSFVWQPYRQASGHRGFSHLPIIGTASRILYLGAIAAIFLLLGGHQFPSPSMEQLWAIAGIEISAWVHLFMDGL